jgi:hypothetical protein
MIIPSNYRQVKTDDTIRAGDIYRNKRDFTIVRTVHWSIGGTPKSNPDYTFWRARKKTAKVTSSPGASWLPTPTKKQVKSDKKNVTVVSFHYNFRVRLVQVISLDKTYLTGLEITREQGSSKLKYQFKKYLLSRMGGNGSIRLEHFGAPLTN